MMTTLRELHTRAPQYEGLLHWGETYMMGMRLYHPFPIVASVDIASREVSSGSHVHTHSTRDP